MQVFSSVATNPAPAPPIESMRISTCKFRMRCDAAPDVNQTGEKQQQENQARPGPWIGRTNRENISGLMVHVINGNQKPVDLTYQEGKMSQGHRNNLMPRGGRDDGRNAMEVQKRLSSAGYPLL
ncbi:hypothetical protein ETB97_002577 [Aspergillus alliaceus]|uniref:Uncharacterized protein n=1 Tax=Petromyces alliaceus TaxID=209559 RepID=A0A8H6E4Z5_PETAA|nr:hypothetical protein ETB97_002577 [Aspergillus burnettii]